MAHGASWLSSLSIAGVTLSLALSLPAGAIQPEAYGPGGDTAQGKAITEGKGVQKEQACAACHGAEGQGDADAGVPRLAAQSQEYLLRALEEYASGIRQNEIMSPIAKALEDGQRKDVTAYYATQRDSPWEKPEAAERDVISYGAALASVGSAQLGVQGCGNCHGPEGRGLPPLAPYLAGQSPAYITARLNAWQAGPANDEPTPANVMARIAKHLGEKEIAAVSQYYAQLPPDPLQARIATGPQKTPEAGQ